MVEYWTPRQWLQNKVDNEKVDKNTRAWAQAALNVVGDDWNIDNRFLSHQEYNSPGITRWKVGGVNPFNSGNWTNKSNGYSVALMRDQIIPALKNVYAQDKAVWENDPTVKATQVRTLTLANPQKRAPHYGGSGASSAISERQRIQAMREAEAKRKEQENNARNLAYINEQLRYMPGELDRINRAEQNKLALINNNYNDALGYSNRAWDRARQDYESDVSERLRTRSERVGMADDDFKKQNDAYSRYFARIGAGNSSVAQYTAPTLLARAASKIRNEIERDNAEQDRLQTLNFNRAKEDHDYNLFSLGRQKALQEAETKSLFDNKRSGYFNELSKLEGQRSAYQGRDYNSIIADARGARDKAVGYANSAVNAGKITPDMTYKPVSYSNVADSDWKYKGTESKIETDTPEEYNDLYNKYFRDEEEKKKKRWGMGISGGI